ncbi:unnamed protein product [Dracunculus medinensis]|uniref:G_PROTEIN_RECEP_F1_2 domain-containing protein n=1 Tax=Dracunculus medinensis TaxID=318479 RepID=A0A0N4U6V5_DRAME|nr:unnamed protein product [Dracunculus medinensis]
MLIILILMTIIGNVLVILSVCVYKRMRTFTNILLISLATSDLLVGLIIMPLSLIDLLYNHIWPLTRIICAIWATTDVLLCTASILNLCIISIDRYMAIISPLKYSRTRDRKLATGLVSTAWILSVIICSPPWFVPGWGIFADYNITSDSSSLFNITNLPLSYDTFACVYPASVPYRIYSRLYLSILSSVMLSVYFKIFRVTSKRESLIRKTQGTIRLNAANKNRITKQSSSSLRFANSLNICLINYKKISEISIIDLPSLFLFCFIKEIYIYPFFIRVYFEISTEIQQTVTFEKTDGKNETPTSIRKAKHGYNLLQPRHLLMKAQDHYLSQGPGKMSKSSREKVMYMKERKALKTITIVVSGFVICWMPFFVLYLIEVFFNEIVETKTFPIASELFLWLGYSNSVLNPIIYTMYNIDFRRCFRDLFSLGCCYNRPRTMSVKKLHQRSAIF